MQLAISVWAQIVLKNVEMVSISIPTENVKIVEKDVRLVQVLSVVLLALIPLSVLLVVPVRRDVHLQLSWMLMENVHALLVS